MTSATEQREPAAQRFPRWRAQARAAAAVLAGRASGALARRLRAGGGTSLPGLVATSLDPHITAYLSAQLRHGSIVITGANGKTTTSGLTAYILRAAGLRIWRNREGANLARGIAAALIIRARPNGRLRRHGAAAMVFEVDEAAFPAVVAQLRPRVVVVTNLFRDQLDRYGEVDAVANHWRGAIATLPPHTRLVLNADDPVVASLATPDRAPHAIYFGVERAPDAPTLADVLDTRTCPRCHAPLDFTRRFYSHIGHWRCSSCDFARPQPTVSATAISSDGHDGLDGMRFTLTTPAGERAAHIQLPGLYNVYNALAAAAAGLAMDTPLAATVQALDRFTPAFGRAERIEADGRIVRLLLVKNPTGLNEVLRALAQSPARKRLLLILNDRPADGADVSWIWDADLEQVATLAADVAVSGDRAHDLALRLKYADVTPTVTDPHIAHAITAAIAATPPGETLFVAPTYTALLEARGALERAGYAAHYWEQPDA